MTDGSGAYHMPVLLPESIEALQIKSDGIYVDATFGGGGHTLAILERLGPGGRLFSFDQDADAEANTSERRTSGGLLLKDDPRFTFVRSNFRHLKRWLRYFGIDHIDGLLADLGVSGHHFDEADRGFSLRHDAPMDMRMNKESALTAANIISTYGEEQLADLFYIYGELRNARRLASEIVRRRQQEPITTTGQLLEQTGHLFSRERAKKEQAKMFQALRIEVNHEMDALRDLMKASTACIGPGGKLVVITYHSLEDRIVKNVMRTGTPEGKEDKDFFGRLSSPFKADGGPTRPGSEELERNPRSRSAKLRSATRI